MTYDRSAWALRKAAAIRAHIYALPLVSGHREVARRVAIIQSLTAEAQKFERIARVGERRRA